MTLKLCNIKPLKVQVNYYWQYFTFILKLKTFYLHSKFFYKFGNFPTDSFMLWITITWQENYTTSVKLVAQILPKNPTTCWTLVLISFGRFSLSCFRPFGLPGPSLLNGLWGSVSDEGNSSNFRIIIYSDISILILYLLSCFRW